jgi:hypothetical protein
MLKLRIALGATALTVLALAIPSLVGAATYYRYADCSSKTNCKANIYTNAKKSKVVTLQIAPKCSDGLQISSIESKSPRISKGKFNATYRVSSYPKGGGNDSVVYGTITVKGTYSKKKNRFTGSWSVDKVSANCEGAKTGKYTAKYKSKQTGG